MEIDRDELAELLHDNGFLPDWREADTDKLTDAVRRLLAALALHVTVAPLAVAYDDLNSKRSRAMDKIPA